MADAETKEPGKSGEKKKGLPTIAVVGISCVVVLFVLGSIGSFVITKFGGALLKKGIESKTGISVDTNGKGDDVVSFTDKKTGSSITVGENKLPDGFPSDFPVYPGTKVSGSMAGSEAGAKKGFWVTMTTGDDVKKVGGWYKEEFGKKQWTISTELAMGESETFAVKKGDMEGSVTISRGEGESETSILVALGNSSQ